MRPREIFLCFLTAAATLTLSVCGCQESKKIDCQIVGHSMAPSFKSEHSTASCDRCEFEFACDVRVGEDGKFPALICGNCGCQIAQELTPQPADQVKLEPGAFVKRWDVVAFQRGDRVLVKRVIGLPGELVDFSEGNLLIGGRVAKKPAELWEGIGTCVFDSNPAGADKNSDQLIERIMPRSKEAWDFTNAGIIHDSTSVPNDGKAVPEFDFLDYRHRKCYKHSDDPKALAGVDDSNPFNQSLRRIPRRVDELDVRIEVAFAEQGTIRIQRQTTKGTISAAVEIRDDQTIALELTRRSGGDIKTLKNAGIRVADRDVEISVVNYDDLIHLLIDGMEYVDPIRFESIENPERFEVDVSEPFVSIGVSRETSITIKRVSIWRDWYLYQKAPKPSVKLPLDMGDRGYYVVGDNLPVSEDSRHFGIVHDIIGVVQPVDGK